jgi:hypothetical protein
VSYADRNMRLIDLAMKFGDASRELGFINGVVGSTEHFAAAVDNERRAWQHFSDALWGKDSPQPEEGPGGIKSAPAGPFPNPAKIDTGDDGIGLLGGAPR